MCKISYPRRFNPSPTLVPIWCKYRHTACLGMHDHALNNMTTDYAMLIVEEVSVVLRIKIYGL